MTYSDKSQVTLTDGTVITSKDGHFPPLQKVVKVFHACEICPVRIFCQDNNEFDCQVYGMFDGFYFGLDDALDLVGKVEVKP